MLLIGGFSMRKYIFLFLAIIFLNNCADMYSEFKKNKLKEDLVKRIDEYYSNWAKLDLGRMWDLLSPSIRMEYGDKEKFLEMWKNYRISVKHYTIQDIQISNGKAKVEMEAITTDNGNNNGNDMPVIYFDYWKLEKDKWVLESSGRTKEDRGDRRKLIIDILDK